MSTAPAYLEQYRLVHGKGGSYGSTSIKRAPYILPHIRAAKPKSVIDYGCGTSTLWSLIKACGVGIVQRYDPAIEALDNRPLPSEMLVSVDVLEHVPECDLDRVIADMASMSPQAIIIIDHHRAKTILPNGENAHATIRPAKWWRERLKRRYPHVERVWGVRRRPASFRTWKLTAPERLSVGAQIMLYRIKRLLQLA